MECNYLNSPMGGFAKGIPRNETYGILDTFVLQRRPLTFPCAVSTVGDGAIAKSFVNHDELRQKRSTMQVTISAFTTSLN